VGDSKKNELVKYFFSSSFNYHDLIKIENSFLIFCLFIRTFLNSNYKFSVYTEPTRQKNRNNLEFNVFNFNSLKLSKYGFFSKF
jgi:hypothetical protein